MFQTRVFIRDLCHRLTATASAANPAGFPLPGQGIASIPTTTCITTRLTAGPITLPGPATSTNIPSTLLRAVGPRPPLGHVSRPSPSTARATSHVTATATSLTNWPGVREEDRTAVSLETLMGATGACLFLSCLKTAPLHRQTRRQRHRRRHACLLRPVPTI